VVGPGVIRADDAARQAARVRGLRHCRIRQRRRAQQPTATMPADVVEAAHGGVAAAQYHAALAAPRDGQAVSRRRNLVGPTDAEPLPVEQSLGLDAEEFRTA